MGFTISTAWLVRTKTYDYVFVFQIKLKFGYFGLVQFFPRVRIGFLFGKFAEIFFDNGLFYRLGVSGNYVCNG